MTKSKICHENLFSKPISTSVRMKRTVCEPLYPFQIFPNMPKAGQLQSVQWEPKRGASIWPPDNLATWPSGHLIHSLWRAATPASNNNGLQSAVGPNKSWSWQGWEARAEHQNMSHTAEQHHQHCCHQHRPACHPWVSYPHLGEERPDGDDNVEHLQS